MDRGLNRNGASPSSSPSPSGSNGYAIENSKRERAKGLKWSSSDKTQENRMDVKCNGSGGGGSEGEEGYIFRSPLNGNGVNSRKRIKLQGMVSGDRCPVDLALVPRRVRSAMKNRASQSASPPMSDSKRRQQHAYNGTQLLNSSCAERFKQNMLDEVTKAEEEVAETLTSLASLFTASEPVKTPEDGRVLEENSEAKAPLASPLEGPKEESTKILVPSNDIAPSNPSPHVEDPPETMKADCSTLGQPAAASVNQKSGTEASGTLQPDSLRKLSSNVEPVEGVTPLNDSINLSNLLGASRQYFPGNGMLQHSQLVPLLVRKQEMGLRPLATTSMEHDMESFTQKLDSVAHKVSRKVSVPGVLPGLHNRGHEQLTMPSSSKGAVYPNSNTVSGRPGNMNGLPAEKLSLTSADKKRPWSKCTTHVNISRLIQSYQKAEKQQQSMPQVNQLKAGTNHSVPISAEAGGSRNGVIPPLSSGALIERSMLEARNRMLQDGMVQAQQAAALSGVYAPQKQSSDLLSSSVIGDTKISANGMKCSGQLHIPYPPNQAVMPFAFPRGAYTSQYQEQFAAGTAQQVQLQLPTYIAGSQLYGPHMGQAAGEAATKQQQLMWQAHLAHYRPQVGFPPKWQQNGRQHDSSSSSSRISQPPSIFPHPADNNPHNLQQPFILPMPLPSSSLSSRSKQMQQHNGSGLSPQNSSQLHMISNTDSFR